MKKHILFSVVTLLFAGFQLTAQQEPAIIDKPNLELESNLMTPEALWAFGRVSDRSR